MATTKFYSSLNPFKKIIFYFGFLAMSNLLFWLGILISYLNHKNETKEQRKEHYAKLIYIWGWIFFVFLLWVLIAYVTGIDKI